MAAWLAKISLLAAGASAWDDTVVLMQRMMAETDDTWVVEDKKSVKANETDMYHHHGNFWKLSRQEELLAMGDTGAWCLQDEDSRQGISSCMGTPTGQACTRCVNGMVTCSYGTTPVLDYHGNTHCATSDAKEQLFKKGCVPGGACQQTCCPPRLAKPMKLLIKDQKERAVLAATSAVKAKDAEIKAIKAEIKRENAEFELAKLQAPKVIPREKKAQLEQIKALKSEIKEKATSLKKAKSDVPARLKKEQKEHAKNVQMASDEIKDMKGSLNKVMSNKREQTKEKLSELEALKQQIKAQEALYKAQGDMSKKRIAKSQQDEREAIKLFNKRILADSAAEANLPKLAVAKKQGDMKAMQDEIRRQEAAIDDAKKKHAALAIEDNKKIMALDKSIAHEKMNRNQATFNPMMKNKQGAMKMEAMKSSVAHMTAERERLSKLALESRQKEKSAIQQMEKNFLAIKSKFQKASLEPASKQTPAVRHDAQMKLRKDREEFKQWMAAHAAANSKEVKQLQNMRAAIATKKSELQQAAFKPLTESQRKMQAAIAAKEEEVKKMKFGFTQKENEDKLNAAEAFKETMADIANKELKLRKSKRQARRVVQRRTSGQLSDLNHMIHDIKDKSKVLVAKEIELGVAKKTLSTKAAEVVRASAPGITKI